MTGAETIVISVVGGLVVSVFSMLIKSVFNRMKENTDKVRVLELELGKNKGKIELLEQGFSKDLDHFQKETRKDINLLRESIEKLTEAITDKL